MLTASSQRSVQLLEITLPSCFFFFFTNITNIAAIVRATLLPLSAEQ
jgi:hypothetical protein